MKKKYIRRDGNLNSDTESITIRDSNKNYLRVLAEVEAGESEIMDYVVPPPADKERKLIGFEFEGVMCSATGADVNGVLYLRRKQDKGTLQPTVFDDILYTQ